MPARDRSFIVIGAGMAGILAAIKLREAGFTRISVFEKAQRLGGTWRDNTYPGLACDIPSHLYSYSFAPNPDWSRRYAPGPEILRYLERTAHAHGVDALIEYGCEVVASAWDGEAWRVTLGDGRVERADFVIAATGILHHPHVPTFAGAADFAGTMFHSARWDHGVALGGRRVGIVGTGSTAVQLVRALAGEVGALTLFQRTAQWVFPGKNRDYTDDERAGFRADPSLLAKLRRELDEGFVANFSDALTDAEGPGMAAIESACRQHLEAQVHDPELRARLLPSYRAACKRLVVGEGFYEALQRPNAELVTAEIERLEPAGVRTVDGVLHPLDVLVLATGFRARDFIRPAEVRGIEGRLLSDFWGDSPKAYCSVSIPGFPNFFMLLGPQSPLGNFSAIETAELQMGYILQAVAHLQQRDGTGLCASAAAMARFDDELRRGAAGTIWATGCRGWFHDDAGGLTIWPFSIARYRQQMQAPRYEDFDILPGRDTGSEPPHRRARV